MKKDEVINLFVGVCIFAVLYLLAKLLIFSTDPVTQSGIKSGNEHKELSTEIEFPGNLENLPLSTIPPGQALSTIPPGQAMPANWTQSYSNNDVSIIPCPHQSWRLLPHLSFQIDIIIDSVESDALEPYQMIEDLYNFYSGHSMESLTTNLRGYRYRLHVPGLPRPIDRFYWIAQTSSAHDKTIINPYFGWYREVREDGHLMAYKDLGDGLRQVSFVLFLR